MYWNVLFEKLYNKHVNTKLEITYSGILCSFSSPPKDYSEILFSHYSYKISNMESHYLKLKYVFNDVVLLRHTGIERLGHRL